MSALTEPDATQCYSKAVMDEQPLKLHVSCVESRGVTIHKSHDSVHTSVFKSRFGMFFGTAVFVILFLLNNLILI